MSAEPVFISYSHDSKEHKKRVLGLSERLRRDGVETVLDQYVKGSPPERWPRWMLDQLDAAEYVLVICTETYYRRFRGHEKTRRGKGVDWEGALITQEIYDERSATVKFVPVLFSAEDEPFIPEPLRGLTNYTLTATGYQDLYDFLLDQSGVEPGPVGQRHTRPRQKGEPAMFGEPPSRPSSKPVQLPYPSLGSLLKGREGLLEDLRKSFEDATDHRSASTAVRVLHGLGGVGKTRAAVEYAWKYADGYSAVLFIDAGSSEAVSRNFAALAGPLVLNLPEQEVPEEERRFAAVLRWLRDRPRWLLILDNLDSVEAASAAQDLLSRLQGGHVLLTGRISEWSGELAPVGLDVLSLDAATEFLLARTARRRRKTSDDDAHGRAVAEQLGRLALALEQAGAYIVHQRMTFAEYLDTWNAERDKVLSWYDPRVMQYPRSLAVTWRTSFQQLTDDGRLLLRRLAWLAAEPIPDSLLDVVIKSHEDLDQREAVADLESYSLVTRATDTADFTIHRLIQEVTRLEAAGSAPSLGLSEALSWIGNAFVGDPQDVRSWPALDPLAPHARSVVEHADRAGIRQPTSQLLGKLGRLLLNKARFSEAEPLLRKALRIDEQTFGPQHVDAGAALNNVAQLLQATDRLAEAEVLMRRALAIDEQSLGSNDPSVATKLNNLAMLLARTDRAVDAEPLMRRALAIDEQSFGADHPRVASRLNNLATVLIRTDRLAEAEPLMRRALAIDEQILGSDHPKVATELNNLAQLLTRTDRRLEAEPLMRRALAIDEQSLGSDHPNVARDLNNLAVLLRDTNRHADAEPLLIRAIAIDEHAFGPDHPEVATDLNNLAQLLKDMSRLGEAERSMRRALDIDEKSYGLEHPEVGLDLINLALILEAGGRAVEAAVLRQRARSISRPRDNAGY